MFRQFQLGPSKLPDRPDVPCFLLNRQLRLQDDHILSPANGHGLRHHLRGIPIGAVEVPHPPQVPGRKPRRVRICGAQILGGGYSRALFRSATDQMTDLTVQLHLRQSLYHQPIQSGVEGAVIGGFSDIHGVLLSSAGTLIILDAQLDWRFLLFYGILSSTPNEAVTAMCAKKKANSNKTWKLAGEPIYSTPLTSAERENVEEEFWVYKRFRGRDSKGMPTVTPAEARIHESAVQAVAGLLCQHYEGRFQRSTVIKVISTTAAIPANLPKRTADRLEFLMGAALWLLDYLEDACDDPDEYLDLLPQEPSGELEYYMPCAEDLIHDQDTILRMVTVLEGREKTYRKEFRALLDLIDPDTAAELRETFKASLLDYLDRALEIYDRLKPAVSSDLPDLMEELVRSSDPLRKADRRSELPEIYFLLLAPDLICYPQSAMQEELRSRKAAELLSGYGTSVPYELCAAYLLLEWEGDALANLNALTAVVMTCALRHLPWAQDDFGARAGLFETGAPDYRLQYEYREDPAEDGEEPLELEWRLSETQLFFLATGVVLPRNRMPSDKLRRWFIQQGVEEQRARELAWAAFMAYFSESEGDGWKDIDLFGDDGEDEEPVPEKPALDEPVEPGETVSDSGALAEQNQALARQVKELRVALHDAERTSNRLREQLRDAKQNWEADRSELAHLRETLYRLRAGEDAEAEDSGPLVELPWQVKRRVVVYGGHDSWRKAVKPLLPGARFYDREELTDLNTVRGADVVWLQVNAMSHKYYYRIIDAARKHDIPVRYFGSASAKKCAVQLALDELVAGKSGDKV